MAEGTKIGDAYVEVSPELDALAFAAAGRTAGEILDEEVRKELNSRLRKGIREQVKIHLDSDIDGDALETSLKRSLTQGLQGGLESSVQPLLKAFPGQVAEVLATPMGPILIGVLAPIMSVAGVTLGAMLGGAIAEGLSLGAIGAGLIVAFKDPAVKEAGKTLASTLGAELQSASGPFKQQVIDSINEISTVLSHQDFSQFFTALTPSIQAIAISIERVIPGLVEIGNKAAFLAEAFAPVTGEFIEKLIPAVDKFITTLIDHLPGIQSAFIFLGNIIIGIINLVGDLIGHFSDMFATLVKWIAGALDNFSQFIDVLEKLHLVSGGTADRMRDMADNMRSTLDASGNLASSTGTLSGVFSGLATNTDAATSAQDRFRKSIEDAHKAIIDQNEAAESYNQIKLQIASTDTQGANALSINTTAGLANRDMLESAVQKSRDLAYQELLTGVSLEDVTAHHKKRIEQLIIENYTSGQARDEAFKLAEQYGAIPKDVKTILEALGVGDIEAELDRLKVKQVSLWKNISESEARSNIEKGMSTGGPIFGPGGPTDDKAGLYPLSDGEYVVKAAAVQHYGYGFMNKLNQSMIHPGMAAGGPVGSDWPFKVDVSQTKIDQSWADGPKLTRFGTSGANASMGDLSNLSGSLGDWIKAASAYVNIEWPEGLITLIMRESGGNPFSLNLWDSNAMMGDPSGGLMQTIGATFRAYADPRVPGGMFDPVANIVAGMNYIHARYGSLHNVQQAHAEMAPMGYDSGGWLMPGTTLVANQTGKPEAVFTSDQMTDMGGGETTVNIFLDGELIDKKIVKGQQKVINAMRRGRG